MSSEGVLQKLADDRVAFYCRGCEGYHQVFVGPESRPRWDWNGRFDKPTFHPSILVRGRQFTPAGKQAWRDWVDGGAKSPAPQFETRELVCHSFVTEGRIQFLPDCTHPLAGQTIELDPED